MISKTQIDGYMGLTNPRKPCHFLFTPLSVIEGGRHSVSESFAQRTLQRGRHADRPAQRRERGRALGLLLALLLHPAGVAGQSRARVGDNGRRVLECVLRTL